MSPPRLDPATAAAVRAELAKAPPLSPEIRSRLAVLLRVDRPVSVPRAA